MSKSKTDSAEQVKFLVSCIGHTTNGRPDFSAVADELGIVSKAAAQKRYERMLKAHNVSRPASTDASPAKSSPQKRTKATTDGSPLKKRATAKSAKGVKEESDDSSEERKPLPTARGRPAIKTTKALKSEDEDEVKEEADVEMQEKNEESDLSSPPSSEHDAEI